MTTNRSIKIGMATMALVGAVAFGGAALSPHLAFAKGGETFTHSFQQATAGEVLAWMNAQGIKVKVGQEGLPTGRLTFAFDGLERDELVRAFGSMVGMRTVKRDGVYSLLKGVGGDGSAEPLGSEDMSDPCPGAEICDEVYEVEMVPEVFEMQDFDFDHDFDHDFDFDFEWEPQDVGQIVEEVMKALEEAGVFSGKRLGEEERAQLRERLHERLGKFHQGRFFAIPPMTGEGHRFFMSDPEQMRKWSEENRKAMEEFHKHLKEGGLSKLDKAQLEELKKLHGVELEKAMEMQRKAMEELRKSGKLKEGEFFVFPPMTGEKSKMSEEQRKAFEESMRIFEKNMDELRKGGGYMKLTPEQIEKMRAEGKFFDHEAFRKQMEEMNKKLGENMKVMQIKLENVKKFIASLTPEQKELADKQGYLRPEDLTKEQRELLGIEGKEVTNMSFSVDGQKIVIRSKGEKSERKGVVTA